MVFNQRSAEEPCYIWAPNQFTIPLSLHLPRSHLEFHALPCCLLFGGFSLALANQPFHVCQQGLFLTEKKWEWKYGDLPFKMGVALNFGCQAYLQKAYTGYKGYKSRITQAPSKPPISLSSLLPLLFKIPKNEWFWFPILRFFSKVYKQNQKNYWSLVLATFHSDTKWEELETSSPLAAPSATGRQTCLRRRSWANSIQPSPIWSTPLPSPMPGTSAGQSESLVNLENSWRKESAGPEYLCLPRKSVCGESCKV